ncbi:LytR cell envelope-related transcriptional attenuator [Bifidobacterium bohemicum]|uniref:LytR/CpsA/Psr regulator C-terminal domain-containing protein n=1 Tax=Bifidobacterium bohemicum DSM 22767 TaxID=1437606 RepID=A0A086ZFT8_9BIFI|nr:LytR C-terminal domain-containing protein [Bifidobacterium bohemicum]KFI45388.1 hypothetical protein BBOH_1203 [Bifidobacterium bohemicum DSM 22767]SCB74090.1 LytR cell envelope-related transcriptional attenuator [Bifidobacterium bohemicum]
MTQNKRDLGDFSQEDIFDNPPEGPIGVHRGSPSLLRQAIPFIVLLIVSVLAGLLVWGFYSGELSKVFVRPEASSQTVARKREEPKSEKKDSAKKEKGGNEKGTDKNDASADSNQTQQQTPVATVNKQTDVQVVNASGINGYAAEKKTQLNQAGYTNVSADNPSGQVPDESVVWYGGEADKATAQDIATSLGIGKVEQQTGIAHPIVVVLKN